jgi:hypothetical protein
MFIVVSSLFCQKVLNFLAIADCNDFEVTTGSLVRKYHSESINLKIIRGWSSDEDLTLLY